MLECPHEREAMKDPSFDSRWYDEHPCPCAWNMTMMLGALVLFSPIWVPLVIGTKIHDAVRGIDRSTMWRCEHCKQWVTGGTCPCYSKVDKGY